MNRMRTGRWRPPPLWGRDGERGHSLPARSAGAVRRRSTQRLPQLFPPAETTSSAIRFLDELPPEEQARFDAMRKEQGLPPAPRYTAEQKQAMREQWDADRAERASGPAGTTKFLQRELDEWRAYAAAEFGAEDISGALTQCLLSQILGDTWSV